MSDQLAYITIYHLVINKSYNNLSNRFCFFWFDDSINPARFVKSSSREGTEVSKRHYSRSDIFLPSILGMFSSYDTFIETKCKKNFDSVDRIFSNFVSSPQNVFEGQINWKIDLRSIIKGSSSCYLLTAWIEFIQTLCPALKM